MLPFLKSKQLASVVVAKRKPEGSIEILSESEAASSSSLSGLELAMSDLIKAIQDGNAKASAKAFMAAFDCLDDAEDGVEEDGEVKPCPSPKESPSTLLKRISKQRKLQVNP